MLGDTKCFSPYYYYCSSFFVGVSSLEEDLGINSMKCCIFKEVFWELILWQVISSGGSLCYLIIMAAKNCMLGLQYGVVAPPLTFIETFQEGIDADFGEAPLIHSIWDDNVHPHWRHDFAIVGQKNGFILALDRDDGHIVLATVKVHSLFYIYITYHYTLGSISSLVNPLNIQMKFWENVNIRVLKTIIIITSYNIDNFVLHIWQFHTRLF